MGESYDDLVTIVELRWIGIRSKLKEATSVQVLKFILAELERNDLRMRILDRRVEKITNYVKIFGKSDAEVIRDLKKMKVKPRLPIKKEYRQGFTSDKKEFTR